MKQFVYASGYGESNGNIALVATGNASVKNLVLKRPAAEGGDILYPIYGKDLTFTSGSYADPANAGTVYSASFDIPEVQKGLEYNVIFVKKGLGINDRSNWSFSVRSNANDTASTIAEQIIDYVNKNSTELGLAASDIDGIGVKVQGTEKGQDYALVFGEELSGRALTSETKAKPVLFDAAYVKDLANKCAADAGFEYTYDELEGLYPNREFNPFNVSGTGFKVFTIRFTEPRAVGTREESIYQVIHVAFPSNADTSGFEEELNTLQ